MRKPYLVRIELRRAAVREADGVQTWKPAANGSIV